MSTEREWPAGPDLDAMIWQKVFRRTAGTPPRFSTDITEAWKALEWLRDLLGPEATVAVAYDHETERWMCGEVGRLVPEEGAATAAHAICLAALRAYGRTVLDEVRQADQRRARRPPLKLED